jgi:hypothetical protein
MFLLLTVATNFEFASQVILLVVSSGLLEYMNSGPGIILFSKKIAWSRIWGISIEVTGNRMRFMHQSVCKGLRCSEKVNIIIPMTQQP